MATMTQIPSMMSYSTWQLYFGDIIILKFPYTDGLTFKRRPALVIADFNDGDVLVCRITSQLYDTSFDVEVMDWVDSGLKLSSIIRIHKMATLEKSLVDLKLGSLSDFTKRSVVEIFPKLVNFKF